MSWTEIDEAEKRRRFVGAQSIKRATDQLPFNVESELNLLGQKNWSQTIKNQPSLSFRATSAEVGGQLYGLYILSNRAERLGRQGIMMNVYDDRDWFMLSVSGNFRDPKRADSGFTIAELVGKGKAAWRRASTNRLSFSTMLAQLHADGPNMDTRIVRTYGPGPALTPQHIGGLWTRFPHPFDTGQ